MMRKLPGRWRRHVSSWHRTEAGRAPAGLPRRRDCCGRCTPSAGCRSASKTERGSRAEDVAVARAELEQAEGELREAEEDRPGTSGGRRYSRRGGRGARYPSGRSRAPNAPIATLLEVDQVDVRIYVPETQIGRVRVGQTASVRVDSFPKELFPAKWSRSISKPSFCRVTSRHARNAFIRCWGSS